jgi:exodeoxyribonuclease VII large subunit
VHGPHDFGGGPRDRLHALRLRRGCQGRDAERRSRISSDFVHLAERTQAARVAIAAAAGEVLQRAGERVAHERSRLRLLSPAALVERGYLRLDDMANRLSSSLRSTFHDRLWGLTAAAAGLERASPERRVQMESHRLLSLWKRLQGASPLSVLNRGFVILRDDKGIPVTRRSGVAPGKALEAEFADGKLPLRSE